MDSWLEITGEGSFVVFSLPIKIILILIVIEIEKT